MIFLDIDVPEYESMRTQEHKVPELLKTIRGRGTLENSNEFGYDERLHLSFTVNEENLIKLLKVYSRFQTLCLIPMFNKNLKKKIYDAVLKYKKNTLKNMLINVGVEESESEKVIKNHFNSTPEETYLKSIETFNYKVNPNINDCLMVFLESFSFKTIQSSSNGYELEMILWICNDLTFYNGDEKSFLEEYYTCFSEKVSAFEEIDSVIDSIFYSKHDDINIKFSNSYNDQKTYNPDKTFEKIEEPISINIPSKYISQVEIRAMNNLHRIPIVGKTKGFIQHLGKGEIGITVKLVFNQKNALEEEIIHDIKSISMYQQEYITTSVSDFFLFKGMDIKELNLSTNIIEEPSDDVDITMITLFFTASGTNKQEMENNYFTLMERADSKTNLKLFNRFLDRVMSNECYVELEDTDNKNVELKNITYDQKLKPCLDIVISKSDYDENVKVSTSFENDNDFKILNLIKAYRQELFITYMNRINVNIQMEEEDLDYKVKSSIFQGFKETIISKNGVPQDSLFIDSVLYRMQRLAFHMKTRYYKTLSNEEKEIVFNDIFSKDNETQEMFLENVYSLFLSEFFDARFISDIRNMFAYAVSNVFKIEILNNTVILLKRILDEDFETNDIYSFDNKSNLKIINNSTKKFDNLIRDSLIKGIRTSFQVMLEIMDTDLFLQKVKDFVLTNYYKEMDDQNLASSIEKSLKVETEKAIERINDLLSELDRENYLIEISEMIFKLQILGCRIEKYVFDSERKARKIYNVDEKIKDRDYNFNLTTESKVYLLTTCISALFIADLNFEKSVFGVIASESAKNFVGPHVVTYSSIKTTIGEISSSIIRVLNGKTYDEYTNSNNDYTPEQITYMTEYKDIYDKLKLAERIYKATFGTENLEDLESLNKTFIKKSFTNKDFQKAHGVTVFTNFDTPMSFIKKVSNNCEKFKQIFKDNSNDLKAIEDMAQKIDVESLLDIESGDEEVKKLVEQCIAVFSPASLIADMTINKQQGGSIVSANFMQTELLSEFKLMRGMRSATRLLQCQYERMMPDYEVYVIDEKAIEQALERGYDYQDKIYAISNIMSINIKKDDTTNIKHAIIKIMNTMPHYVGLNTILESQSIFNENKTSDVVYSNKFTTEKLVFRSGMLVNISIDQSSQFFDFTGKIDSVELTNDIITLKCSNFAAELLGNSFDISNVHATGWLNPKSHITRGLNLFRRIKREPDKISNSKIEYLNGHLIPKDYTDGKLSEKEAIAIAGASGIIYTAIDKSIESLKHLDCPYNELILGRNLTKNMLGHMSNLDRFATEAFAQANDTTSHRISENINAVEFDLSFYGIQKESIVNKIICSPKSNDYFDYVIGQSSFIPKSIQGYEYSDTIQAPNVLNSWTVFIPVYGQITTAGKFLAKSLGKAYSYKRGGVKMYDVLNDLTFRNPATYWDVFESGHYGTLFFGRNNYLVTRKNKVASLSREDIDKISSVIYQCFDKVETQGRYISFPEYIEALEYLSESASLYDPNFSKEKEIHENLNYFLLKDLRTNSKFCENISEENKDLYDEESMASNIILAISGYNLVSCTISTNENYINTVDIKYKPGLGDIASRLDDFITGKSNKVRLKSFEGLPDERLRVKFVEPEMTTNIHTKEQAFEYAQSVMYKELINYYTGKIVILYYPDIKKNDEVLLIDSRNHISGKVVVKDFEHILDAEAGALTIITPGMKVSTSSMMTDVYLTGMINKIEYEWLKMKTSHYPEEEIDKVNQGAINELQKLYGSLFKNIKSIPIAFEYTGYKLEFDEENYNNNSYESDDISMDENGGKNKKVKIGDIKYKNPETIVTPRNISSLPFKIYPLIKNGRALIPDEDIYNSVERPFSGIQRLLTALYYSWDNLWDFSVHAKNIKYMLSGIFKNINLSDAGIYERIVEQYFPGFRKEYLAEGESEAFIQRLLNDNYYHIAFLEKDRININPDIWDKESMIFFNCKKLNQYDTDRIKRIAKTLCQYKIVNLVELDGRITSDKTSSGEVIGHEKDNFTVVELLRQEMENYCNSMVFKSNKKCRKWTTVIQRRLITEDPYKDYDDIGAVLINCDIESAQKIITEERVFKVNGSWYDNGTKVKSKNVIFYKLNINNNLISFTHVFLFHNYFGKELGNESLSYELRREILKNLINNTKSYKDNVIILGDFNLVLRDRFDNLNLIENANNEYFNLFRYSDYLKMIKETTTVGNAKYDQIVVSEFAKSLIDKTGAVYQSDSFNTDTMSDHYPIYLFFKSKYKLID